MGMQRRRLWRARTAVAGTVVALAAAGSAAAAFQPLPLGAQVNDDPAAGIDPAKPVDIADDPANSDVTGGSLASGVEVPWSIFRQKTTGADQIFSRSFANGAWTTRGAGTVGGASSASPTFRGSLNFDQTQDGEAPSIDFAGANRAVPWATWYEHNTSFGGKEQIFASRFDNSGGANQGKWIFSGQDRGSGVPSLNINTNQDAENPVVAGGSTADPTKPGPWITWQEQDANGSSTTDQIFVSKPIGPGSTSCTGDKPSSGNPIGGFCFQQVGIERVNSNHDPSLNVDPTRAGIEPDIAFTGPNDSVPWVVWYEVGAGALASNDQVFAAKAVAPSTATPPTGTVDGGLNWVAVGGNGGSGTLDVSGHSPCLTDAAAEKGCTLNASPAASAQDPRVAAGTMTLGNPTVPWVAWEETSGGHERIFVSRLVNGAFKLANGGQPLATLVPGIDAKRPDITFSGNTPYVSWHEGSSVVTGHFTTPDAFVIDNGPTGSNVSDNVRAPASSGCAANPFNQDGASCQAGAVGTPFFLFTDGDAAHATLFANGYRPDAPVTGAASGVSTTAATLNGSVNPEGAAVKAAFQFGPTTAYGQSTSVQKIGVSNASTPFSAVVNGFAAGTTIHYRAVATSDFGTFVGVDQTLKTASPAPPPPPPPGPGRAAVNHAKVKGTTASVRISCSGASGAVCKLTLRMTVTEKFRGRKLIAITSRTKRHTHNVTVTGGLAHVTLQAGHTQTIRVSLNRTGKRLLVRRHHLNVTLKITQKLGGNASRTVSKQTLHFKAHKRSHRH
jgi:hypothetical protein